jgi:ankyrin repeat protein
MIDCSICCDAITAATGRTVMNCGHEFHMACLVRWLQKPDGTGNCPYCRAEPTETERLVAAAESESDFSDDSEDDLPPLMAAIRDHDKILITSLLATANVHERCDKGNTALCYAVIHGEYAAATALLLGGADLTVVGRLYDEKETMESALMAACENGSLPCVKAALASVGPNYVEPDSGMTPLMATVYGDLSLIVTKHLLNAGADVFAQDASGWNAFMWLADNDTSFDQEGNSKSDIMAALLVAADPRLGPHSHPHKHGAAIRIQAVWRGYTTRTKSLTPLVPSANNPPPIVSAPS